MATSRWRSSLANVETRLRRSLGLSGPVDLELDPRLTPVIIADDATRPGSASEVRGRRWRWTVNQLIGGVSTGSVWLLTEQPYPSNPARVHEGGVIVDRIQVSLTSSADVAFQLVVGIFPTASVLNPGIPIAVTTHDVYFVDPMRFDGEPAPLMSGKSGAQTAYAARPIWEAQVPARVVGTFVAPIDVMAGDLFLNWNSCLVIGTGVNVVPNVNLFVNVAGRVF